MSTWRRIAISLFPEHNKGSLGFQRSYMTIYQVFFELKRDIDQYIQMNDNDGIGNIIKLVNWCFSQRFRAPDIWNAAATAFLEHLADTDERARIIPYWVKPPIFEVTRDEFEERRERKGAGKFKELLEDYNRVNGTHFG